MKNLIKLENIIPLFILILLISLTIIYFKYPSKSTNDFASFLSGISTVGILILTAFYVIYTNRQIKELQSQRQLQIQPLPYIEIEKGIINSPKLVYDPTEKGKLSLALDFNFHVRLKNVGNGAAVLVDTFCHFVGKQIKYKPDKINAWRFTVIAQEEEIKYNVILRDDLFEAITALNIGTEGPCVALKTAFNVLVRYNVLYRNILGAVFLLKIDHIVSIDDDVGKKISEWIAAISSFETDFSNDIARFNAVYQRDVEDAFHIFSKIENNFYLKCPKEAKEIELLPVDQLFVIKHLETREFNSISDRLYHGIPLGRVKEEKEQKKNNYF